MFSVSNQKLKQQLGQNYYPKGTYFRKPHFKSFSSNPIMPSNDILQEVNQVLAEIEDTFQLSDFQNTKSNR